MELFNALKRLFVKESVSRENFSKPCQEINQSKDISNFIQTQEDISIEYQTEQLFVNNDNVSPDLFNTVERNLMDNDSELLLIVYEYYQLEEELEQISNDIYSFIDSLDTEHRRWLKYRDIEDLEFYAYEYPRLSKLIKDHRRKTDIIDRKYRILVKKSFIVGIGSLVRIMYLDTNEILEFKIAGREYGSGFTYGAPLTKYDENCLMHN